MHENRFVEIHDLQAITPHNSLSIQFTLKWCKENLDLNWALVILSVSGRYLPECTILEYALSEYDGHSNEAVEQLALYSFDLNPDCEAIDGIVDDLIRGIGLAKWEFAFEQLFFLAVKWLYLHWENYDDPLEDLYAILDDFYFIGRGSMLSFHDVWPRGKTRSEMEAFMHEECKLFLKEEEQRLNHFDFEDPADIQSLDDILSRWRCYNEHSLPMFLEPDGDGDIGLAQGV